jgi:prevent-host-death family protein
VDRRRIVDRREDICTVSSLKIRRAALLDQVNRSRRPVIVMQGGVARAVVLDIESYDRLLNAIAWLKLVVLGEEAVRDGKTKGQRTVFKSIRRRLEDAAKAGARRSSRSST